MINKDLKLQYMYKDEVIQVGDICRITTKDFKENTYTFEGAILDPVVASQIEMDCSDKFKASKVSIDEDKIVNIEILKGVTVY